MNGTTLTILPDIGGLFTVRDFGDGGAVKRMYLPILKPEPFEITINNLNGEMRFVCQATIPFKSLKSGEEANQLV